MKVCLIHQILTSVPVWMLSFSMGINYGWLGPTMKHSFNNATIDHVFLNDLERTWIVSVNELSRVISIIIVSMLIDKIGRMAMFLAGSALCFTGWGLLSCTSHIFALYLSRVMFGFAMAVMDINGAIYMGEISSPETRGFLVAMMMVSFMTGLLTGSILAAFLPFFKVARIILGLASLTLLSGFALKETPNFLLLTKKEAKAKRNFLWLFSDDDGADFGENFDNLKSFLTDETGDEHLQKSGWQLVNVPAYRKSMIVVCTLNLSTSLSGYWVLMSFITIILRSSSYFTEQEYSYINTILQFTTSLMSVFFLSKLKRRQILLMASALVTMAHALSALLLFVHEHVIEVPHFPLLIWATVTVYMCLFSAVMIPTISVLMGELFPQRIKSLGCGVASLLKASGSFITSLFFLYVKINFGMYVNFILFSSICLVNFVIAYVYVPETKGKTLSEIQRAWGNKKK